VSKLIPGAGLICGVWCVQELCLYESPTRLEGAATRLLYRWATRFGVRLYFTGADARRGPQEAASAIDPAVPGSARLVAERRCR
jgi:hypothetical protein